MSIIDWPDGEDVAPDGRTVRQIPGGTYDEQTWISEDGMVVPRTFDYLDDAWVWGEPRGVYLDEADNSVSVDVFHGGLRQRTRLARAIALAWRDCTLAPMTAHAHVYGCVIDAAHVGWVLAGTVTADQSDDMPAEADPAPERPLPASGWRPLTYEWHSVNGDLVERVVDSADYLVHREGAVFSRLCSKTTRGHRTPDGARWAAIAGKALVRIDYAVALTFGLPTPPAKAPTRGQAALAATRQRLLDGTPAAEICAADRIAPRTLWNRLLTFAAMAPYDEAQLAWQAVPRGVRKLLEKQQLRQQEREGVKALLEAVRAHLGPSHTVSRVEDHDAYGMLRVGWTLARRARIRERVG